MNQEIRCCQSPAQCNRKLDFPFSSSLYFYQLSTTYYPGNHGVCINVIQAFLGYRSNRDCFIARFPNKRLHHLHRCTIYLPGQHFVLFSLSRRLVV